MMLKSPIVSRYTRSSLCLPKLQILSMKKGIKSLLGRAKLCKAYAGHRRGFIYVICMVSSIGWGQRVWARHRPLHWFGQVAGAEA
jgi:hypothetical protein